MDSRDFDSLTKTVAAKTPRRLIIRGAAGTLLGGVLARLGLGEAEAQQRGACRRVGQTCRQLPGRSRFRCCAGSRCNGTRCVCGGNLRECRNECIRPNQCCNHSDCPNNQRCIDNRCGCGKNRQECGNRCLRQDQCCHNRDCPNNQRCLNNNQCGCPQGQRPCNGGCIADGAICLQRVTPNNLRGWEPFGEDPFSADPLLTTFVNGPGTPPIGNGSILLDPSAVPPAPPSGNQAVLRNRTYAGTRIADISQLGYSIFVPAGGDPPTMQLAVLGVNTGEPAGFASLVFVPGTNGNPAFNEGEWTAQSPQDGFWFVTRNVFGPNDECLICRGNGAPTGSCAAPGACDGKIDVTWNQILAAMPNAFLNGNDPGNGGFSFRIGRGDTGEGNLTAVIFDDDGYFFESA